MSGSDLDRYEAAGPIARRQHTAEVPEDEGLINLRDVTRSVMRARALVLGIALAGVLAAAVFTAFQDRVYESEATIFVTPTAMRPRIADDLGQLTGLAGFTGLGQGGIATESALLQSRIIAEAVVDSLGLHVVLEEPQRSYATVFRVIDAPRDATPGRYELLRRPDGTYSVRGLDGTASQPSSSVSMGTPFRLGDVTLVLDENLAAVPEEKLVIVIERFERAVQRMRREFTVAQAEGGAQLLRIRARHQDSVRAAEIPNVATRHFIRYRTDVTKAEARSAVAFLQAQVENYGSLLRDAEERLRAFRESNRVLAPTEAASQQVRHLADLQARRDMLVAERDAIGRALTRAEQRAQSEGGASPYRELASFPVFLSNGAVQSVLRALTDLENELSALLLRRTADSDEVRRVRQRIEELEAQLHQTAHSYRAGLDNQITTVDESIALFGRQLESVPQEQIAFARLMREQQLVEEIYTLLQKRLKEAEIREVENISDVRIVDAALVPGAPVAPRPVLNLLIGLVLGAMFGVAVAAIRGFLDPRVRTRQDLISATDGLPVLGMIPHVPRFASNGAGPSKLGLRRLLAFPNRAHDGGSTRLIVCDAPDSIASEAYRNLRTNLRLGMADQVPRVITICSVAEGDGKSTNSANLAVAMAQQGFRTVLIDCDLRRPRIDTLFGQDREPGMVDVLTGRMGLADATRRLDVGPSNVPLSLITAGRRPASAAELIGSVAMRDLVQELRTGYDVVIIDAPPLAVASEAVVLGALADATLLVARATVTDKRALAEAVDQLRQLRIPLAGLILNDIDPRETRYASYGAEVGIYEA